MVLVGGCLSPSCKFVQPLKQNRHPTSKHHLTNTCRGSELHLIGLLSAILLLKQALMSEVGWNHQEHLPEEHAWDYFPLSLLMLPVIPIAPITYPVPTGVLLQVLRCWGFIPLYLKIHAWYAVFSLAFQLCSSWLSRESVWTLKNWEGREVEREETSCYVSFFWCHHTQKCLSKRREFR